MHDLKAVHNIVYLAGKYGGTPGADTAAALNAITQACNRGAFNVEEIRVLFEHCPFIMREMCQADGLTPRMFFDWAAQGGIPARPFLEDIARIMPGKLRLAKAQYRATLRGSAEGVKEAALDLLAAIRVALWRLHRRCLPQKRKMQPTDIR